MQIGRTFCISLSLHFLCCKALLQHTIFALTVVFHALIELCLSFCIANDSMLVALKESKKLMMAVRYCSGKGFCLT